MVLRSDNTPPELLVVFNDESQQPGLNEILVRAVILYSRFSVALAFYFLALRRKAVYTRWNIRSICYITLSLKPKHLEKKLVCFNHS